MIKILEKRLFPVIEIKPEEKRRLSKLNGIIDKFFEEGKVEDVIKLKPNSTKRLTILYGPWICDFKCPSYCYTKGTTNGVLNSEQAKEVIKQAQKMGAKLTYWVGEGELTLLRDFWDIMDYQAKQRLPAVVFTNGSIFHDDKISTSALGIKSDELVEKIRTNYPDLHLYVKFWHSDQEKAAEMYGVDPKKIPYTTLNGRRVPLALAKLYETVNRERLGVEVIVSRENYDDVVNNIIPTIKELGIYGFLEPVLFSGNAKGKQQYLSLTPEQHKHLESVFASGGDYCEKRQSTDLIVKGSKLTPGISVPPRNEDSIIDESGNVKDVFSIYHNEYFRDVRKRSEDLTCLCRTYLENPTIISHLKYPFIFIPEIKLFRPKNDISKN